MLKANSRALDNEELFFKKYKSYMRSNIAFGK